MFTLNFCGLKIRVVCYLSISPIFIPSQYKCLMLKVASALRCIRQFYTSTSEFEVEKVLSIVTMRELTNALKYYIFSVSFVSNNSASKCRSLFACKRCLNTLLGQKSYKRIRPDHLHRQGHMPMRECRLQHVSPKPKKRKKKEKKKKNRLKDFQEWRSALVFTSATQQNISTRQHAYFCNSSSICFWSASIEL